MRSYITPQTTVLDWGLMIRSSSKGQGQFSPGGASEDCLEVCFVGLVVRRNYVWYIVIFFIFMGFGGAELGDALKTSFGLAMQATRGGDEILMGKRRFSLCNTAVLNLTGYCKKFYRILLFHIFLQFHLFCIYSGWQGHKGNIYGIKYGRKYGIKVFMGYEIKVFMG